MRIVITGGPSTGKTTIISLLEAKGYPVIHEFATQIIQEGVILPWVDRAAFQAEVLRRQIEAESKIIEQELPVFLDRGLFDGEAYYLYDKMPVPSAFNAFDGTNYSMAFLVEELPFFDLNHVRRENLEFTKQITDILEHCYASRNIPVARVPALPALQRVEYILSCLSSYEPTGPILPVQQALALSP